MLYLGRSRGTSSCITCLMTFTIDSDYFSTLKRIRTPSSFTMSHSGWGQENMTDQRRNDSFLTKRTRSARCTSSKKESSESDIISWLKAWARNNLNWEFTWRLIRSFVITTYALTRSQNSFSWLFKKSRPFHSLRSSCCKRFFQSTHTSLLRSRKDALIDTRKTWDKDFLNIELSMWWKSTRKALTSKLASC